MTLVNASGAVMVYIPERESAGPIVENQDNDMVMIDFKLISALITESFVELPRNRDGCISPRTKGKRKDNSKDCLGTKSSDSTTRTIDPSHGKT